ncbi:unnamed protein product [Albugo candida]|uniref:Uncharacterized protein n=1 Tax=Albugo candida TaxID=65357 RepID=A0A024GTZ4_9STRA|nr:unnamed protein product [Albugo candida]|eukprot:CCI50275.1 unnamed protein product [Albugo candida]
MEVLYVHKNKQYKLYDGQTIALLFNCAERVLLEYLVEASRRNSTIHTILQGLHTNGNYHPIDELDVKRECNILKQSLTEAAQWVLRAPQSGEASKLDEYQVSQQIHLDAKFSCSESFRVMVTMGYGLGLVHPIPHNSLNEIYSSSGKAPLRLYSTCLVARKTQRIRDHAAIEFIRSFYLALATGKSTNTERAKLEETQKIEEKNDYKPVFATGDSKGDFHMLEHVLNKGGFALIIQKKENVDGELMKLIGIPDFKERIHIQRINSKNGATWAKENETEISHHTHQKGYLQQYFVTKGFCCKWQKQDVGDPHEALKVPRNDSEQKSIIQCIMTGMVTKKKIQDKFRFYDLPN